MFEGPVRECFSKLGTTPGLCNVKVVHQSLRCVANASDTRTGSQTSSHDHSPSMRSPQRLVGECTSVSSALAPSAAQAGHEADWVNGGSEECSDNSRAPRSHVGTKTKGQARRFTSSTRRRYMELRNSCISKVYQQSLTAAAWEKTCLKTTSPRTSQRETAKALYRILFWGAASG